MVPLALLHLSLAAAPQLWVVAGGSPCDARVLASAIARWRPALTVAVVEAAPSQPARAPTVRLEAGAGGTVLRVDGVPFPVVRQLPARCSEAIEAAVWIVDAALDAPVRAPGPPVRHFSAYLAGGALTGAGGVGPSFLLGGRGQLSIWTADLTLEAGAPASTTLRDAQGTPVGVANLTGLSLALAAGPAIRPAGLNDRLELLGEVGGGVLWTFAAASPTGGALVDVRSRAPGNGFALLRAECDVSLWGPLFTALRAEGRFVPVPSSFAVGGANPTLAVPQWQVGAWVLAGGRF